MTMTNVGVLPVSTFAGEMIRRVEPDADLWDVADRLVEADVGAMVVGDDRDIKGVVSERDLVRALAARRDLGTTTAMDIAQTRLVWCDANSSVAEVATEMMEHYVRHVLIEDEGRFVGVVSARDLLSAYAAAEVTNADVA